MRKIAYSLAAMLFVWLLPESHAGTLASGYDEKAVAAFVAECAKKTDHGVCSCTIDRYQASIPYEEFTKTYERFKANSPSEEDVRIVLEFARSCSAPLYALATYPDSVITGFVDECAAAGGGGSQAACTCVIERFKAEVPWSDYLDMTHRSLVGRATGADLRLFKQFAESCANRG